MHIATIFREYFGNMPDADTAADMEAYTALPEMTVRAAFDRTRRYAERPSWAYAKRILDTSSTSPEPSPRARRSVLCDNCGKPFDPDWMTCEGWYAFCKGCIDFVRSVGVCGPMDPKPGGIDSEPFRVRSEYTASAEIVRSHFGLSEVSA